MIGTTSLVLGIGILLYRYLQTGTIRKPYESADSNQALKSELEEIRLELLKLKKIKGTFDDSKNLNTTIENIVENILNEDFILSKIDEVYSDKAISQSKLRSLYNDFEELGYRIESELTRLRKSANLNLVIGTLTTTLAIIALGYEVFKSNLDFTDTVKLLSHYLPRLSILIFIEIFAFFFLKLYKTNLCDIKYFHNEKTNIDFKLISIKTAIHLDNYDLIKLSIEELIRTERNFKLKKDETTVELEKTKNETENNKILGQLLKKLTDKL